jgi:hypothetical protein
MDTPYGLIAITACAAQSLRAQNLVPKEMIGRNKTIPGL